MQHMTTNPGEGTGSSVLVVEDDAIISLDIEMMLEQNGYMVFGSAASIEGALELLETGRPDVALLDMNLRGSLVFPVAKRLRSLNIPFVLVSAYRAEEFGGDDILEGVENVQKPILERRLLDALRRALRPDHQ